MFLGLVLERLFHTLIGSALLADFLYCFLPPQENRAFLSSYRILLEGPRAACGPDRKQQSPSAEWLQCRTAECFSSGCLLWGHLCGVLCTFTNGWVICKAFSTGAAFCEKNIIIAAAWQDEFSVLLPGDIEWILRTRVKRARRAGEDWALINHCDNIIES